MTLTLDTDTGVICYSVLKWQTPRQNNHLGKEAEDHQGQHLQSVSTTRGKALLSKEEDGGEVTRQVDEADGAGERRPVHLAKVAQDDGNQAAKEGCSHQREHCVDHLWGVLHLPCSKYKLGLDDESDASENKGQVEYFKDPTSLF